jgi:hypothetical protein
VHRSRAKARLTAGDSLRPGCRRRSQAPPRLVRVLSPTRVRVGTGAAPSRAAADPSLRASVAAWATAAMTRAAAADDALAERTGSRPVPPPAPLPAESEVAFRAALRDGVALCSLANALRPGVVPKACAAPLRR